MNGERPNTFAPAEVGLDESFGDDPDFSFPDFDTHMAEEVLSGKTTTPEIAMADQPAPERAPSGMSPEEAEKQANTFQRKHQRILNWFAKSAALKYEPSAAAETFSFSPKELKVNVPLNWFASEQYNDGELLFANCHELSHFADMRKNPEAYLKNFDQMGQDAERLAADYLKSHPQEHATPAAVQDFYYQELHTLYNCLDDVYVNNLVFGRAKHYLRGDGRESVNGLYQKVGYEDPDLTNQPLHRQFALSLLRDEMVGEKYGASKVDTAVEQMFSKKVLGESLRSQIEANIKPKMGVMIDPAERYRFIRTMVQPRYLELLEVALEQQEQQEQQEQSQDNERQNGEQADGSQQEQQTSSQQSGQKEDSQQSGGSEFNPFGQQSSPPDSIMGDGDPSEDVIREILEGYEEEAKVEKMSAEEREAYQAQKQQEQFDAAHGISKQERAENQLILAENQAARRKMRKFWHQLIGKSVEYRQQKVRNQRRGRLDVNGYIRRYPEAIEAERKGDLRELEIYERNSLERQLIDQPEAIDVSLLVDCSGSMDDSKIAAAQRTASLLMYSIKDFNDELNRQRRLTHSKLRANTQVITFGSDFTEVKPFERHVGAKDNEANIIKSISKINNDFGATYDDFPLASIREGLTPQEKSRIQEKKLKKIVFEITDGASSDKQATAANLKALANEGVLVVGFQIGNVGGIEREIFEETWNGSALKSGGRGIYIGEEIDALPERLMSVLSDALKGIRI